MSMLMILIHTRKCRKRTRKRIRQRDGSFVFRKESPGGVYCTCWDASTLPGLVSICRPACCRRSDGFLLGCRGFPAEFPALCQMQSFREGFLPRGTAGVVAEEIRELDPVVDFLFMDDRGIYFGHGNVLSYETAPACIVSNDLKFSVTYAIIPTGAACRSFCS